MGLVDTIKADLIKSMKEKNGSKLSTLRLLVAEIEKEKILNKMSDIKDLSDEQVITVVSRQIKKLDKEIEAYISIGRGVDSQELEKRLLKEYLPEQATEEDVREVIYHSLELVHRGEIVAPQKYIAQHLKGRADMKFVMKTLRDIQSELDDN